jgi:hypothetical protein
LYRSQAACWISKIPSIHLPSENPDPVDTGIDLDLAEKQVDQKFQVDDGGSGIEEVGVRLGDEMVRVWRMGAECLSGWCRYFFSLE